MGVPYEIPPMAGIDVVDAPVIVPIAWCDRSYIEKIIVVQTTGVLEAFIVALYNHPMVEGSETVSDSIGSDVGDIPADCYRVTHDLVAGADGKLMYFSEESSGGSGFAFFGQKAKVGRQGQRDSTLYLKITPIGGGAKKFAVVIGGSKEVE